MNKEIILGTIGTSLSAVGTAIQTNQILQTISLILTIFGAILTYFIGPLYIWFKKSKSDGKITKEEIEEGKKIIKKGIEKINKSNKED